MIVSSRVSLNHHTPDEPNTTSSREQQYDGAPPWPTAELTQSSVDLDDAAELPLRRLPLHRSIYHYRTRFPIHFEIFLVGPQFPPVS